MRFYRNPFKVVAIILLITATVLFSFLYQGFDVSAGEFRLTQAVQQKQQDTGQQHVQQNTQQQVLVVQENKISTKTYFYGSSLLASKSDNVVTYYHNDYLGSVRLQSDANAKKSFSSRTAPFGSDVYVSGSTAGSENSYKFTGQESDSDLYYYGARYYDTKTGRFTQLDPVLSAESPYAYVSNNPLNLVDPDGEEETWYLAAIQGTQERIRNAGGGWSRLMINNPQVRIASFEELGTGYRNGKVMRVGGDFNEALNEIKLNPDFYDYDMIHEYAHSRQFGDFNPSMTIDERYGPAPKSTIWGRVGFRNTMWELEYTASRAEAVFAKSRGYELTTQQKSALRGRHYFRDVYWKVSSLGSKAAYYGKKLLNNFKGRGTIIGCVIGACSFAFDVAQGTPVIDAAVFNIMDWGGATPLADDTGRTFSGGDNLWISPWGIVETSSGPVYQFPTIDVTAERP